MKKAAPVLLRRQPAPTPEPAPAAAVDEVRLATLLEAPPIGETAPEPRRGKGSKAPKAREGRQTADSPRRRADRSAGELMRLQVHLPVDVEHALRAFTLAERCSISHAVEASLRATLKRRGLL